MYCGSECRCLCWNETIYTVLEIQETIYRVHLNYAVQYLKICNDKIYRLYIEVVYTRDQNLQKRQHIVHILFSVV